MPSILIVEDDKGVRQSLAENLKSEGFRVLTAEDGQTGLELARSTAPDLIILDLMLPILDGLSVCRLLRRDSSVPILMLSARGMEMDKITGLETGADDYVVKPFSMGELMARVKAALRRGANPARKPGTDTQLSAGNLTVDLIARRVFLAQQELHLTHKEFNLLVELMRNQGAVLSRDLLMTQVWGDDYLSSAHTVDVHIRWLREKIESDPSTPQRITTVRGVGYRFEH